jgi:hypothetical protein
MSTPSVSGRGRETRLLLLVIVVAVAVLLVLAQFQYPAPDRIVASPMAGPIERLAARATFEELALIMGDLSTRVQPAMTVVTVERIPPPAAPARRGAKPVPPQPTERRIVAALRIDTNLAVAHLPEDFRVVPGPGIEVATEDPARRLVLVRVPDAPFTGLGPIAQGIGGPGYVAVFEGARGGPAVRPLFIGRVDSFDDANWTQPLLSVGGDPQLNAGAFIYTLDGRLVGMTMPDDPGVAITRVPALLAAVEALRVQ